MTIHHDAFLCCTNHHIRYSEWCIHNMTGTQSRSFWPHSHSDKWGVWYDIVEDSHTGGNDSEISIQTQHRKQSCITSLLRKASVWVLIVIISKFLKATEQIQTSSSRSSNGLSRCCGMSSLKPFCSAKNWASMPRMNRHWTYSLHVHNKFNVSNYTECTTRITKPTNWCESQTKFTVILSAC